MRSKRRILSLVLPIGLGLTLQLTVPLEAQITYDGCTDARGAAVVSVARPGIGDIARALIDPATGAAVILYDPNILPWVTPQFRLWLYGHECAHHALGHTLGRSHPLTLEQEADCWGVVTLFQAGMLSWRDLPAIQQDLAKLGQGDWTHLPGPARAVNLESCLQHAGFGGRGEYRPRRREPCRHPLHPRGDITPCSHPAHPRGDIWQCSHTCRNFYGYPVPCHPRGDLVPCSHPAHPRGDIEPCQHVAHPSGH